MLGVLITKWTIRLALVCYVAYLASWLIGPTRWSRASRVIWTLGCVLFDVHVACAFHFYHRWSHAIAWQHTAERTEALLGVAVGDGIYFSYLFLVLWQLDVIWLWSMPFLPQRSANAAPAGGSLAVPASADAIAVPMRSTAMNATPWWRIVVHVFLLFIAINGAIVFESGPTRWSGIAACVALGCLIARRAYNSWQCRQESRRETGQACEMFHASSAEARPECQ